MLELVHDGHGTAFSGDFDRCARCQRARLCSLWLSVLCSVQVWWAPKLPQWLMHGLPLRPVVLPVWELCCPLRGLSTSSRLRLSTERSDWLRERWRPLPKGGWGKAGGRRRRGGGLVLATKGVNEWSITGTQPWRDWSPKAASAKLGTLCCAVCVDVL